MRSEPAIIHSDLDAVWIKNPISKLNSKYDIIASCDTGGFPVESFSKWNFTMCMGWVYFKNNSCVKSVFDKILKSKKNFDDQEEFNLYFQERLSYLIFIQRWVVIKNLVAMAQMCVYLNKTQYIVVII